MTLFCFTDLECLCHPVHHPVESGPGSAHSLLHAFSPGFGPVAAETAIQPRTEKHGLRITKGKLHSAYDKSVAKFRTIYPQALVSV